MTDLISSTRPRDVAWKIALVALAYSVAEWISGGVLTALEMPWPEPPGESSETTTLLLGLVGSVLIAGCIALLATGLRGGATVRWLVLAAFTYVTFGLNNQIEAAIFTTFGGFSTMALLYVLPCLAGAAVAATLFPPPGVGAGVTIAFRDRPLSSWWWRLVVAWLAFPMIYYFFGALAGPIVVPLYQQQDFGLILPTFGTIVPVALGRSALYLAVSVPVIVLWGGSRRRLSVTLAIAFFAMMGLVALLTTTFFPPVLRITHTIEILGDAVAYAWVLVALFVPRSPAVDDPTVAAAAEGRRSPSATRPEVRALNLSDQTRNRLGLLWKIPVVAVIYTIAKTIGWALVTRAGMPFAELPEGHTYSNLLGFLSVLVLSACLVLLARGIGGTPVSRWAILMVFTYVSFVINNQIEHFAFSTTAEIPTMLLFFVLPCLAATVAAVLLVGPTEGNLALPTVFSDRPVSEWWWRLAVAWLAFPVIYHVFGVLIYPLVAEIYAQPESGLRVPSPAALLGVVAVRSLFFLAATLPIIVNWRRSRWALVLSLAAAFTAMIGVVGAIESSWEPGRLRIVHSLEIAADSLVHAWVLVALLVPRAAKPEEPNSESVAVG